MPGQSSPTRPHFPQGYLGPNSATEYVSWDYAQERLQKARAYWIGTVSPDGQPYITPVWGIWMDNQLFFDGSPETRRGRNIAANPKVVAHLDANENGEDVLILQGEVREITAPEKALAERLAKAYTEKYAYADYSPAPDTWDKGGLYTLKPNLAMAWTNFTKDPTRWQFTE